VKNIDFITKTKEAAERIRDYIIETPVELSLILSQKEKCQVYLKMEIFQNTGSFKIRGAANMILSLSEAEKERGIVASSSGNQAAAVAHMLHRTGVKGTIFLPENVSEAKILVLRAYGVPLEFHGTDVVDTEMFARETAQKKNKVFIPPYNHPNIIAGQATVGLELQKQLSSIDAVFVPIGGGGLISGIAGYLKSVNKEIEIIGCQPQNSPVMYESVKAGRIITMESAPSLADGTAGGICNRYVDDYVLVSEDEIKEAVLWMLINHFTLIEGAAALSIASFMKVRQKYHNKNVVLLITGKKISLDTLKKILCNNDKNIT